MSFFSIINCTPCWSPCWSLRKANQPSESPQSPIEQRAFEEINYLLLSARETEEKGLAKEALEKAYQIAIHDLPPEDIPLHLGAILSQFGRLCYEENFALSKEILLYSLGLQLSHYGILEKQMVDPKRFATLPDLKAQIAAQTAHFSETENDLLSLDIPTCLHKLKENQTEKDLILAFTLRWLGHSYQNIDGYKKAFPENDKRFEQIYYFCEAILLKNTFDKKACLELAELYYNSWPFLHLRKHPNDYLGACAAYDSVLAINDEPEMKARVANMRFILLNQTEHKEKAQKYLEEAMEIRSALPEEKQNGFLLANLRNNYAAFLLQQKEPDLDKAAQFLLLALDYSTKMRKKNEDHLYFALYDLQFANLQMMQQKPAEALDTLERAVNTLNRYPESNQELLLRAAILKAVAEMQLAQLEKR